MPQDHQRTEPYSLWAHVESKRCFPESAIKGWGQQAKEKEQKAKIEEAYEATVREAARKTPQRRERTDDAPPTLGPAPPPPMRDAQIVEPRRGERLETITSFQVKQVPKPRDKSRVVQVKGDDRSKKGPAAPHLDDEAGVGDVGERANPSTLKSRSRTPPKGRSSGQRIWKCSAEGSN